MDRRDFLKIASVAGMSVVAPTAFGGPAITGKPRRTYDAYGGLFFVSINASGGWDPTSMCDPKGAKSENDPNPMNASYLADEIAEAGNIRYAPLPFPTSGLFGMNVDPASYTMQTFFEKYSSRLCVINGIDVETNGHDQGSRNTWSGRLAEGHPTLAAFMAGALGREQPMAFLAFGGYAETAGICARTRAGNTDRIVQLAYPQRIDPLDEASGFHHAKVQELLDQAQAGRDQSLIDTQGLPKIRAAISTLFTARSGSNELKRLQQYLPTPENQEQGLRGQAQLAIAAYRAGICISANLDIGGYDTHGDHDNQQIPRLLEILDGVDFLMEEAERQGVADKVVVACGSDFGRTPYYNGGMGKDHWSTTSMMFMGPGIAGNRVIGSSDGEHNSVGVTANLDPDTSAEARKIHPADIHYALRKVAGLHDGELAAMFPLDLKGDPLPLFG